MFADMGCAEVSHSGLCDAVDAIFEYGKEGRSEFKLTHNLLICIKNVTGMSVTKRVQR